MEILDNKVRFILGVINDKINIKNVKRKILCQVLIEMGFTPIKKITKVESTKLKCFKEEKKEDNEGGSDSE